MAKVVFLAGFSVLLLQCSFGDTCHREGCEALDQRMSDAEGTSRIAGILASEDDVVANGCQECGFASATISAWSREGDEATTTAVQAQTSGAPLASTSSCTDGKYTLALDVGDYWACSGISCFAASVNENNTTTLNIKLINGISNGYLAPPDAQNITPVTAIERTGP